MEKKSNFDTFVRKSYECAINSDINDIFIIYEEANEIVEIPYNMKSRMKVIDKLIKFFEDIEEYEKCQVLLKIKQNAN
jgi:hypothetical protein